MRPLTTTLALCLCLAMLSSCGSSKKKTTTTAAVVHKINVVYDAPTTDAEATAKEILKVGGTDGVSAGFAHSFKLPHDLTVHVASGFVGPNYNPQTRTITLSYGFVDYTAGVLRKNFELTDEEFGRELAAIDGFIFTHEFAHALIDQFQLPVLGKEEDAADSLASVFLTRFVDNGAEYAFDAAKFFNALSARQRSLAPSDYWDAHSLDKQRAYEIVCWIAGSSEDSFNAVSKLGILSTDRLQSCPAEFQQKVNSWRQLLKSHVRA